MRPDTDVAEARPTAGGAERGGVRVPSRGDPAIRSLWPLPSRPMFVATSPFSSLDEECLAILRRMGVRRSFANGQTIHMQDDEARFLNVVTAGHVRLSYVMEDGSAVLHDVLPEGEIFGELGAFDRSSYPDMATAVGQVSLFSLPIATLMDLTRTRPDVSVALHRAVAIRYREYINLVRDLSLQSLPARLAQALIRVADRLDVRVEYEGRPALTIGAIVTQTDLGLMARGSRGNVNRALQAWQRSGWIVIKDRSILVLDRSALAALAVNGQD